MRSKIVAGNWKMNCNREEALSLATEIKDMLADEKISDVKVILAPPFIHISALTHIVMGSEISVAAQNCSWETSGAYTGEVSAAMIQSTGAAYVLIGHSERRSYFSEDNQTILKKTALALENNLIPVLCIGETLPERESGNHEKVIASQLDESVFKMGKDDFSKLIIAYEPVWAIGTGKTATAAQAQEMHFYIRSLIKNKYDQQTADHTSILYGGSCNENNAKELFGLPDVDGGLIGGASLKSRSFVNIVKSF